MKSQEHRRASTSPATTVFTPPPTFSYTVFVSYAHTDGVFADRLVDSLKELQYTVWMDRQRLLGGQDWNAEIRRAIERCRVVIVILTPAACKSPYVTKEWKYALGRHKQVIPVIWRPCTDILPDRLKPLHRINFSLSGDSRQIYQATIEQLRISIESHLHDDNVEGRKASIRHRMFWIAYSVVLVSLTGGLVHFIAPGTSITVVSSPTYLAKWHGRVVTLRPVNALLLDDTLDYVGQVTDFETNYPADACFSNMAGLRTYTVTQFPLRELLVYDRCSDGTLGMWTFNASA